MDSMGWVLYRQGEFAQALKVLEKAYAIKADPEIVAHIAEVLTALNRKDDARNRLTEAAKQFPDNEVINGALKKLQP
jgi:Flp pilus assembly protein TadD